MRWRADHGSFARGQWMSNDPNRRKRPSEFSMDDFFLFVLSSSFCLLVVAISLLIRMPPGHQ
ncbi:hypothetical protein GCM10007857_47180 [Bradyrhizobium iriomotense]|uniref:Transmembrane protein n=1 Tax=Bradyrhizobium iriomotense TaxID=441950 RepID=A0ABQ6B3J8_9BRAD|nr:hypothetical protein GCM10007857_47180 [Bradyrhizobium iriomotense]